MAGTGHIYEIANLSEVMKTIANLCDRVPEGPGRDWFFSRKFLRYMTSENFVFRVEPQHIKVSLDSFDPAERDLLAARVGAGGDVRMFNPFVFSAAGGHARHIADWISWLVQNDARLAAKLPRITVEQAIRKSQTWTGRLTSRKPETRGAESVIMKTPAGRQWVELLDDQALAAEGFAMSHCVGSYGAELLRGQVRILSLRDGDRSLLTVELRSTPEGLSLRQAQGFANNPPTAALQECLIHLLERLEVEGGEGAEAAGVCPLPNGKWARLVDAWDRIEWNGFLGVRNGRTLILMSPLNPARTLCKLTFSSADGNLCGEAVIWRLENRHFHIDELRAVAAVCNKIESYRNFDFPITLHAGRTVPVVDTQGRREIGGVTCIVIKKPGADEVVHVSLSTDDARTLMTLGYEKSSFGGPYAGKKLVAKAYCTERWNAKEQARCLAVATAMNADVLTHGDETDKDFVQKKHPVRRNDGRWSFFFDEAEKLDALTCCGTWFHTDDRAEARLPRHRSFLITRNLAGEVNYVYAQVSLQGEEEDYAEELAAFLNVAWPPSRSLFGIGRGYCGDLTGNKERSILHYVGGRWAVSRTVEEFVSLALSNRRRVPTLSVAEAESAFAAMPFSRHSEDGDRLLAAALKTWSKSARKHASEDRLLPSVGLLDVHNPRWSHTWEGRLRLADRLMPLLDEATRKRISALGVIVLKETMRGRPMRFNGRAEVTGSLLLRYHRFLSDTVFKKALKRAMADFKIPVDHITRTLQLEWFGEIRERARSLGVAYLISENADMTIQGMPQAGPIGLETAKAWAGCFRIAFERSWHYHADRTVAQLVDLIDMSAIAYGGGIEWERLRKEAAEIVTMRQQDALAA